MGGTLDDKELDFFGTDVPWCYDIGKKETVIKVIINGENKN